MDDARAQRAFRAITDGQVDSGVGTALHVVGQETRRDVEQLRVEEIVERVAADAQHRHERTEPILFLADRIDGEIFEDVRRRTEEEFVARIRIDEERASPKCGHGEFEVAASGDGLPAFAADRRTRSRRVGWRSVVDTSEQFLPCGERRTARVERRLCGAGFAREEVDAQTERSLRWKRIARDAPIARLRRSCYELRRAEARPRDTLQVADDDVLLRLFTDLVVRVRHALRQHGRVGGCGVNFDFPTEPIAVRQLPFEDALRFVRRRRREACGDGEGGVLCDDGEGAERHDKSRAQHGPER